MLISPTTPARVLVFLPALASLLAVLLAATDPAAADYSEEDYHHGT